MTEKKFRPAFENYESTEVNPFEGLEGIQQRQLAFEKERVGTDMSLYEYNNPVFLASRGIVGEGLELAEALEAGDMEAAKKELLNVIQFAFSIMAKIGLPIQDLEKIEKTVNEERAKKYKVEHFKDKPIREGLLYSRYKYNGSKVENSHLIK